ncbi:MAG: hypothetical protein AAF333_09930 [Planctomycetota bacterium]
MIQTNTRSSDNRLTTVPVSSAIVGPFHVNLVHTHNPEIGEDLTPHAHPVELRLEFKSNVPGGMTFVINQETKRILQRIIKQTFSRTFESGTFEDVGELLFNRIESSIPDFKGRFNRGSYHLHAVRLNVDYDDSPDHPSIPVEYITRPG